MAMEMIYGKSCNDIVWAYKAKNEGCWEENGKEVYVNHLKKVGRMQRLEDRREGGEDNKGTKEQRRRKGDGHVSATFGGIRVKMEITLIMTAIMMIAAICKGVREGATNATIA